MKIMSGALVAVLMLGASAAAQTPPPVMDTPSPPPPSANCANVPAPPPAPDGATISHSEMTRQRATYDAWIASYSAQRERCVEEIRVLRAQAEANAVAFEAAQAPYVAASAAWVTQVEVFNARASSTRRRDPRSVNN